MVNIYSFMGFCDNIIYAMGPNNNIWLTEAAKMDIHGYDMLDGGNFALFWIIKGVMLWVCMGHGDSMKNWRCCTRERFGKNAPFALACRAVGGVIAFPST